MKRVLLAAILVSACSRGPHVPTNTLLWHVDNWSPTTPTVRRAPARMVSFYANGEYLEHVCYVIEQMDGSIYISRTDPHVVAVGRWTEDRPNVTATRTLVWRTSGARQGTDPLCSQVDYTISGNSVVGKDGQYSPLTSLVAPDWADYMKDAQKRGTPCPQPAK